MSATLEFFFDYISPNAYLAWHSVEKIAKKHSRELVLRPVLFPALLHAYNQVGPAEVAPKRDWMVRNCLRKARVLGIALQAPYSHPFNPLPALRLTLACPDNRRLDLTTALFRACWAQSRDISAPMELSAVLRECDLDPAMMLEAAASDTIKHQLRACTDAAVAAGVFGVPTTLCDDELFFGFDDLPWLEQFLRGEDIMDTEHYTAWRQVQPSAWRNPK